jgi:hypothetical protein
LNTSSGASEQIGFGSDLALHIFYFVVLPTYSDSSRVF